MVARTAYLGETHTVEVEVVRSGNHNGAATVDYTFTNGTALNGVHFNGVDGTINWADGEFGSKAITFEVIGAIDPTSAFTLELESPTGTVELGSCVELEVTIEDGTA